MDRGAAAAIATALWAALAASGCARGAPSQSGITPRIPAAWVATGPRPGDTTAVLWAFRTADCLSCMAVDYDVRRVQARFGTAVPLIAVHVGSEAQSLVPRAYFRSRRLRVDHTVTLSARELADVLPDVGLPALYLVQGRRIVWSTFAPRGAKSPPVQLDTLVQRLRVRGLSPVPANSALPPRPNDG